MTPQVIVEPDTVAPWIGLAGVAVGVVLSFISTAYLQRQRTKHDARAARERIVGEVEAAAEDLRAAIQLFRTVTTLRRTFVGGLATAGANVIRAPIPRSSKAEQPLIAGLGLALRDAVMMLAVDGLADRVLHAAGDRYLQIVLRPRQRLVSAAVAIRLGPDDQLTKAAEEFLLAAARLSDEASARGRTYKEVEAAFRERMQNFP